MRHDIVVILFALVVLIPFAVGSIGFAEEPEIVELAGGRAKVTLVEGGAQLYTKEPELKRPLSQGDMLRHGDRVVTGDKSRIELAIPDGSFLRFDEKTTFELVSAQYDEETKQRDITKNRHLVCLFSYFLSP